MRYTLSNFYKSDEWRALLNVLKSERVNKDGEIICEHCGKPIVRAYDCIGHHKIALTEENVNDAYISLAAENIMLVHHKCHNKIHNKLGYSDRKIYVVYGSPLSGKSTWVESVREPGDLVVDIDSIWQCVSGCERYEKPNRLRSVVFGVRDTLIDMVKYRRGKWLNAYIIGGYPFAAERERLVNSLGAEEIFIDTSMDECMSRLRECVDGRSKEEWENYIADWWKKYSPRAPQSIKK